MTASQIYQAYHIMPNLKLHMYRVAAVGQVILDYWTSPPVDRDTIIKTLLLHDIGNIIKFKLDSSLPRLNYWKQVQQDFINKYGHDVHAANHAIAQELALPQTVIHLLDISHTSNSRQILANNDWSSKLCWYADMRVSPKGVVSVDFRFKDLLSRYRHRDLPQTIRRYWRDCLKLEQQLQPHISINLGQITNQAIEPYLKTLPDYPLTDEFAC